MGGGVMWLGKDNLFWFLEIKIFVCSLISDKYLFVLRLDCLDRMGVLVGFVEEGENVGVGFGGLDEEVCCKSNERYCYYE